jgi:cohesin complex subunit SCC1
MFYSDVLLNKTGPLARIWLAANVERRLTKKDYLQQNLEDAVDTMVDETSAPMALRLSGQLLLGVVKIYKKKAVYLMEDCNDALLKIKMVRTRHSPHLSHPYT